MIQPRNDSTSMAKTSHVAQQNQKGTVNQTRLRPEGKS